MIAEHTLNMIRDRLNLVDIVQEYVSLKKSGQSFIGLCPFHNEKTPSFHVHGVKQVFKCFGCQKGGNLFTFYSAVEGLSFPEAVEALAKRAGVPLEKVSRPKPQLSRPKVVGEDRLVAAHEWAAKYFHYLLTEHKDYAFARDYVKTRGIGPKTVAAFRLGVAPRGWSTLRDLMVKRGFSQSELVAAGLVVPRENSPTQGYDRFRERLMFPIQDRDGRVIGFGGRLLKEESQQPKYLNSPESPLFSKRQVLYGLYQNARGIRLREEALVVEGYMDVVGLAEAGVNNAVATLGTALTEEHCLQIRHLTRNVVTIFDPDKAGTDAWHRSVHMLMEVGLFAKDLSLPDGLDPDEFVLSRGAEAFHQLCAQAPRQATKLLREIAARGKLAEGEAAKVLESLTPLLVASRRLPDRALLWDDISLVLNVSRQSLKELAEGAAKRPGSKETAAPAAASPRRAAAPVKKPHPLDQELFKAAVTWPHLFQLVPREEWVSVVRDPELRQWLERLHGATDPQGFERELEALTQTSSQPWLLEAASGRLLDPGAGAQAEGDTLFRALRERLGVLRKQAEIEALKAQVRLSQRLGDEAEQMRLLARLRELRTS